VRDSAKDEPGQDLGKLSYEQLVELLETLTRQMSSGEVGIEEAADLYERASAVHREASERLAKVRERVERIREAEAEEA
jgi:exodeoxyribonuclease VII small subunit